MEPSNDFLQKVKESKAKPEENFFEQKKPPKPTSKMSNSTRGALISGGIAIVMQLAIIFTIMPRLQACQVQYGVIDSGNCGSPSITMFMVAPVAILLFVLSIVHMRKSFSDHDISYRGALVTIMIINVILMIIGFIFFLIAVSS